MKKVTVLIIFLLLTTSSIMSQITKSSNNEINSKLWDEASINHFVIYMEDEIKKLLGENSFDNKSINSWVEQIVDESQKKLKSMKKPNYKYISEVIILPRGNSYKKNTGFWWQPKTDKAINVKVDTESLHCLLVIYCVRV